MWEGNGIDLISALQDFLGCDTEKDGRSEREEIYRRLLPEAKGEMSGRGWEQEHPTREEGRIGTQYYTYMYHANPAPAMHQDDTTYMATARIHLML